MNRFWGRNDGGLSIRFSRDDEQILALNYENLCDGDYLNRLFVTDNLVGPNMTNDKDSGTSDATSSSNFNALESSSNHPDSILFSSDLAEDLVIFGNSPDMGRAVFEKRFHYDLSCQNFSKTQDSITNLISRQAIVFDYIGKLMLERCIAPNRTKLSETASVCSSSEVVIDISAQHHIASEALACTLGILERKNSSSLSRSALESLLSIIFQVVQVKIFITVTLFRYFIFYSISILFCSTRVVVNKLIMMPTLLLLLLPLRRMHNSNGTPSISKVSEIYSSKESYPLPFPCHLRTILVFWKNG